MFHVQDVDITSLDGGSILEVKCIFTSSNDSKGSQVIIECETVKENENLQYILMLFKNSITSKSAIGSPPCSSICPSYSMSVFDVYDDTSLAKFPAVTLENVTCHDKLNSIVPELTHQLCK